MYSICNKNNIIIKNNLRMTKITSLSEKHIQCVPLLEGMFKKFGILPLDSNSPMPYWAVESKKPKSLLDKTILTNDGAGNELRAVFFIVRKKGSKSLKLFRITELFPDLHKTEAGVTISEALELFVQTKTDFFRPIMVVNLGKLMMNDILYAGGFLYEVPANAEIGFEVIPSEALKESGFPEETED